ncbi:MAG TPA: hypothetical protein VIZ61_15180 [Solirubrobacterales bacterium]
MGFEVSITFDEFGWSVLEDHARAENLSLDRLLALACGYYESELASGRTASRVPRFGQPVSERESRTFLLELDKQTVKRLEEEAERQELGLERLIEHAAIFFLADLDAGRVAERIIRLADSQ